MRDAEMYEGFDLVKQQEHEKYLLNTGVITQQQIDESWEKVRDWKKPNWEHFKKEGEQLNQAFANALKTNLKPEDVEVQALVQRHYEWVNVFWTPTHESYTGLAQMYLDHPDFREFYNKYHPNLVEYLVEAMRVYAAHKLS